MAKMIMKIVSTFPNRWDVYNCDGTPIACGFRSSALAYYWIVDNNGMYLASDAPVKKLGLDYHPSKG
jgi:hypothetical protein